MAEWFRPGEYERVDEVLSDLKALNVHDLRIIVSWAEWHSSEGDGWYAWLLSHLARDVNVLPCVTHTPPSLGVVPKSSAPPSVPKTYADFLDVMITRLGSHFEWIELWNEPDNLNEWDVRLDPEWNAFTEMIGGAAYWAQKRGKKTILPALSSPDSRWLQLMSERGVLRYVDAVGIQAFPNAAEHEWHGWSPMAAEIRPALDALHVKPELWVTQTGFSTWRGDERAQLRAFLEAIEAPVDRVYWRCTRDPQPVNVDISRSDQRDYHFGLKRVDGRPKLLYQVWSERGLRGISHSEYARTAAIARDPEKYTLITGGAGFIGSNLASRLLRTGRPVLILDNLSRSGAERNLAWLRETYPEGLQVEIGDVRDAAVVRKAVRSADQVFHFAAQVAVTSSLVDPRHDFEVNLGGTLTLLEAIRAMETPPPLLYTSTNKVYGALDSVALEEQDRRYLPVDPSLRTGINETRSVDFRSPYGCSKGAADQYVLDYARTFGLAAVVFRMSCIYGPHQNGTEDQGWVAHFLIRALENAPICIYGDGKQVRDLLYVEDLVDAFLLAQSNIQTLSGQAFNIGGGLGNTISLLDLLDLIEQLHGSKPRLNFKDWRASDQRYYVSDIRLFRMATGWDPIVNVGRGVRQLYEWFLERRGFVPMAGPVMEVTDAVPTH